MANILDSKGYFSGGGLYIYAKIIQSAINNCGASFDFIVDANGVEDPNLDLQEFDGQVWNSIDPAEYTVNWMLEDIDASGQYLHQNVQVILPEASKNTLYRVQYTMNYTNTANCCDSCSGSVNVICRTYLDASCYRDQLVDEMSTLCNQKCDTPIEIVNKVLQAMALESASYMENNCSNVATLFNRYNCLKVSTVSNCGCNG